MSTERKGSTKGKDFSIFTPKSSEYKQNTVQTHQQHKSSLLLLTSENASSSLKTKLIIQTHILKQYETWVNILLSIINSKSSNESYCDLGTPIQKELEHVGKLQTDNFKLKAKLIEEIAKNKKREEQLKERRAMSQLIQVEVDRCRCEQIAFEKNQLMSNLQVMANELDEQSERNKHLHEGIVKEENASFYALVADFDKLKNENLLLKQVIELQNDKNKQLSYEQNDLQRNSLYTSTQHCLSARRLGNYLIEEEEDWRNDFGLFTCRKAE